MQNYKKNFVARTLAWILAVVMVVTMVPINIFAEQKAVPTPDQRDAATKSASNWHEQIDAENDYWEVPKGWLARNLGGLTSTDYAMTEVNYLGTYTDQDGNDVIRLELDADTRSYTASWMDNVVMAFKFPKKLFEAIDWDKSYVYSGTGTEEHFNFNSVKKSDYQAGISFSQIRNGWLNKLYELPINLVLKQGVTIESLGKEDFLVQHRGLDINNKLIFANIPGAKKDYELNDIEYGQFTKSTIVPLSSNIKSTVIPANSNKESNFQRYGTSSYDSERKVIRTIHNYRKSDSLDSYLGNVGFTQSFDARLLDLMVEDEKGNVAYLDVLNEKGEKAYNTTPKVAITRDQINVKDGVATVYVVGSDFESNLEKSGMKVVRATSGNITTGIYSTLFKTATVNYVATTIEYNIDEDLISKLFPQNKYLKSYAFCSGFIHENKNGFMMSDQQINREIVIPKNSKLTLDFKDKIDNNGNQYVLQIGETFHLMNDRSAPHNATEFETIAERNAGSLINKNIKYDINMLAGRTLHAGDPIRLWIINDGGRRYVSEGWRLFINTGNKFTDVDIVNVMGKNFKKDYNPVYFQHSKSVDGVMVTKYKYVPQVEEIFDTDKEIKGTVRKDENNVSAYYIKNGSNYYTKVKSKNLDDGRPIILNNNGKEFKDGVFRYDPVFDYGITIENIKNGNKSIKLKKDMPIYLNTARVGQFPSDPVVEQIQSVVTFDLNEGKLLDEKSFEGYEDRTATARVGRSTQNYNVRDGYKTQRADNLSPVKRIAPVNKRFYDDINYEPNGFEGSDIKDMSYTGDWEELRKFPRNPELEHRQFYGWTTQKLTNDDVEGYDQLEELTNAKIEELLAAEKAIKTMEKTISEKSKHAEDLHKDAAKVGGSQKTTFENLAKKLDKEIAELKGKLTAKKEEAVTLKDAYKKENYIFTKNSPILDSMTVYAFYGPYKSVVVNPEQRYDEETDTQYIGFDMNEDEENSIDPLTEYNIVRKIGERQYEKVANLPLTTINGRKAFDITNLSSDVFGTDEYYIESIEPNKSKSYSIRPIRIDKTAPTESQDEGQKIKATPDLFNYMVKITGSAQDEAHKILKATVEVDGKVTELTSTSNDEDFSITLNDYTLKQMGNAVSYKITVYDAMGNKFEKNLEVAKAVERMQLSIQRPSAGSKQILLKSKTGASLKIRVIRNKKVINLDDAIAISDDYDVIPLTLDNSEFKLEKGDRIIVDVKCDGYKDERIMTRTK